MRVVVPYLGTASYRVWNGLDSTGWPYEPWPLLADDRAYYDLLACLWTEGRTFCVVEHDVVINPDTLTELDDCEYDWCAMPYDYMGTLTYGLGCVKFSADLLARVPDAMRKVGVMHDDNHPKRHWCRLDAFLQGVVLPGADEVLHKHTTPVTHLGTGCAHGCTTYG